MSELVRFGVSLDKGLAEHFDKYVQDNGYANRSRAIGDLITSALVNEDWENLDKSIAGVISMVYDHHKRELLSSLMNIQHDYHHIIISSQHIHLDHDYCLEVIILKGSSHEAKELYKGLKAQKGILHTSFSITSPGGI